MTRDDEHNAVVREIVEEYLTSTGVTGEGPGRRYLWNDAFAVCTLLALHRRSGETRHLDVARRLVDRVHRVLGRHREDDPRTGWISGLSEEEGARRPTAGGLRIGKALPERGPDEPTDPDLEWERDGQYYHYLTRWMEALERMARVTGEGAYLRHAVELARAAHRGFVHGSVRGRGAPRMVWKMSIDLSRPLVASAGQHDPLDGFVVLQTLKAAARRRPGRGTEAELEPELDELGTMVRGREWATADPLGIGGLLGNLHGVDRLGRSGDLRGSRLRERLAKDGARSLEAFAGRRALDRPPQDRLAFRELGLALGLRAVEAMDGAAGGGDPALEPLMRYVPLADHIEAFWLDPAHRNVPSWGGHRDINLVMLAAALAPEGYLGEGLGDRSDPTP